MSAPQRFVVTALILLSLSLSGCKELDPIASASQPLLKCDYEFKNLMPPGHTLVRETSLDANGDGQPECVVFYHHDQDTNVALVYGVVYHRDRGEPTRWLFPVPLGQPNKQPLGEHRVAARMAELLSGNKGTELVIEDFAPVIEHPDLIEEVVQISIFGWRSKPEAPSDPGAMSYKLLGTFASHDGVTITISTSQISVIERTTRTPSQLANRRVYTPRPDKQSYYLDNGNLVAPEVEIRSLARCNDSTEQCYPEKTVLDFYQHVKDDTYLKELMTEDAFNALKAGKLSYGCSPDRTLLDRVLVQDIKIQGTEEQPQIVASGKCKYYKDGTTQDMKPVTWKLEKIEGRWRIKKPK